MSKLDRARSEISAHIANIEAIPAGLRIASRDESDLEPYEIVRRIQRRMERAQANKPQSEAAE